LALLVVRLGLDALTRLEKAERVSEGDLTPRFRAPGDELGRVATHFTT